MERPAARSISERHHLASRSLRRHSSRLALSLGMSKAAARLFPAEDAHAVFEDSKPASLADSQSDHSVAVAPPAEFQEESESSSGSASVESSPPKGAGAVASENDSIMDAVGLDSMVSSARKTESEAAEDVLQEDDLD